MKHPCPHCGKEIDPAQILGAIRTPKKEAAWKKNGERLKQMYANWRKVDESNSGGAVRKDALGPRDSGKEPMGDPEQPVSNPATPAHPFIAPKGSFSKDDLKAMIQGRAADVKNVEIGKWGDVNLETVPHAPFDVNIEGEPHRVAQLGKRGLYLFYVGEDGQNPVRPLALGELEALWEKRIK